MPNARGYFEGKVWMGTKADGKPDRRGSRPAQDSGRRPQARPGTRPGARPGPHHPGKANVPTVRQMLKDGHLTITLPSRGTAPKTIYSYQSDCRNHIYRLWGGQKIDRLLPEHIEDGVAPDAGRRARVRTFAKCSRSCPRYTKFRLSAGTSLATRAGW